MRAWAREGGILVHDEVGGGGHVVVDVGLVWISSIEVFDDGPWGMEDWFCWGDERFDLRTKRRRNAMKMPRKRSFRLRGFWVLDFMCM